MTAVYVSQIAISVLESGTPKAVVNQVAVEVLESGTPKVTVSRAAMEVLRSTASVSVQLLVGMLCFEVLRSVADMNRTRPWLQIFT